MTGPISESDRLPMSEGIIEKLVEGMNANPNSCSLYVSIVGHTEVMNALGGEATNRLIGRLNAIHVIHDHPELHLTI